MLRRVIAKRRGLSEVVSVLAIIVVALIAVFGIRAWLTSQQARLAEVEFATATYSVTYVNTATLLVSLKVANNLPSPIEIVDLRMVLSDGTVVANSTIAPRTPLFTVVAGRSEHMALFTVNINEGARIASLSVKVRDIATGKTQWIEAIRIA